MKLPLKCFSSRHSQRHWTSTTRGTLKPLGMGLIKYPWKVRGMKEIMANFHEFMMMDKFSSTFFQFEILLFYELSCLCFDPRKKMSLRWVYSNWDKKFWLQARESRRMFDLVESFGSKTLQPAQHVLKVVVVHSRTFHRFFSLNSERFSE